MREREPRLHYFILPLAAFIAIAPLILNGCSCGHDFDFHILNWFEAARQFTHGNLHPHWAYTPAWNAGEPRYVFYPPISWTIGAIVGLILPWTWTPIAYTWLALTAAGFSLYYLAKEFATRQAALLAAAFYIVNPYTLFTAYERTAYAELLAAAWIPLLLHAILREKVTIPRIAIPIALLWLTNAPAAVMSCYMLALLTLIRLIQNSSATTNPGVPSSPRFLRLREASRESGSPSSALALYGEASATAPAQLALNTVTGTLLGLGLAAFYIVPAACERRYVQIKMAILPGMRIQDNFLFHHTSDPDHDRVLLTASIIALILIATTATALTVAKRATKPGAPHLDSEMWASRAGAAAPALLIPLAILTAILVFLLTPISSPIWNHVPEVLYLQFPWRLLAILAPVMALAIAIALSSAKLKPIPTTAAALILTAALATVSYAIFYQPCDEGDTVSARVALFHSNLGTDPTDEYTPIAADNDALAHNNPPYWLAQSPAAKAPPNATPGPAPSRFSVMLPAAQTLILNLRDYPMWSITRNGTPITMREQRDDGLIAIPLPAGTSNIAVTFIQSPDQTIGDILTALAAILLLLITLRKSHSASL